MSVQVVFHGQANVEIHSGSHVIQIDPFYTGNPLCTAKAEQANPQHILLTHAHSDHVGDTESIARRTGAEIVANYEVTLRFAEKKLKISPMNHGGGCQFPFGHAFMTI